VGLLLNAVYMGWNPIYMSLLSSLPGSLGSSTILLMLVFSYLGDITTSAQRTIRMSLMNLCIFGAEPVGMVAGGAIYSRHGYKASLLYLTALSVVGAVYSAWRLKDPRPDKSVGREENGLKEKLKNFFSLLRVVKETIGTLTKRREGHKKAVLLVMETSLIVTLIPAYG
jgi:PCFT/HCP family folate transporter-like MFS transporter 1/3